MMASFLESADRHDGSEPPPRGTDFFDTSDPSTQQHPLLSFLQPEAALVISTTTSDVDDDMNCPDTSLPPTAATALISAWTLSPTSAACFDHDQSDTLQFSAAAITHGGSFVVLEQPGADRYFLPADQITATNDAGSQCLLEVSRGGSDDSGEEAEVDTHYDASSTFPAVQHQQQQYSSSNNNGSEETRRKERRREQNRRAAQRCRARRKMREAAVVREVEKEMATMRCLEREVQQLTSQKQELEMTLRRHGVFFVPGEAAVVPGHRVVTPKVAASSQPVGCCYNLPLLSRPPTAPETLISSSFGVDQLFDEL